MRNWKMKAGIIAGCTAMTGLVAGAAWAADCGDTAGAGGTRIACGCSDTVVTSTKLKPSDPVVDASCGSSGLKIGADDVTLHCRNNTISGIGGRHGIEVNGYSGVMIKNCSVVGFIAGIRLKDSDNITVRRNHLSDHEFGIEITMFDHLKILYNRVTNSDQSGIVMVEASDSLLQGNRVEGAGSNAFSFSRLNRSAVLNNQATGSGQHGMRFSASSDNVIARNRVKNNLRDGIELAGGASRNAFRSNMVSDNGSRGIFVCSSCEGNDFESNFVRRSTGTYGGDPGSGVGMLIEGNDGLIAKNRGDGNADTGLEVTGDDNTVEKNNFSNNGDGICAEVGTNINGGGNRGRHNAGIDVHFPVTC